ncbi:hypothetical protein LDC_2476 [sediment metagenome]|uniref:Uncharacterized protein n=1 Tax=sediment metagenome TaxID=749907 RepID=D9PLQ3_9ZZZZ
MLTAYSLELYATSPADSVASFTDKTTIGVTDITPLQTKVANKYTWRKITGLNLWNQITDTTEARITTLLGASNSWNGINDFDGATFNSGSHGKVTFSDSAIFTSRTEVGTLYPYNATSFIGDAGDPFLRIYSKNFVLINSGGTDSAYINIGSGGEIEIPRLTVTEQFIMDSSSSLNSIIYTYKKFEVPNTGDTIMTFTTKEPFVELDLPGNVTPGISRFDITGAAKGQVVRIYNGEASYTIILEDYVSGDDNLYLSANFTMGTNDVIELMCIDPSVSAQKWIEISRSNN